MKGYDEMFDFSQNQEVTDLNTVPENLRSCYTKKDDKDDNSPFVIRTDDPAIAGLVAYGTAAATNLQKERKNKPKAIDLAPLADYGDTPEAILEGFNKKVTALEAQVKDSGAVKSQIEEMKREMTQAHAAALGKKDETIWSLTEQLDDYMMDTEIAAACSLPQFKGLNPKLIAPFAKKKMNIDVDTETQKRTLVVLDNDGNTRYSMDRPGEKANVVELLTTMSKDETYMQLFPSDARTGGGEHPNSVVPNNRSKKTEGMTPAQKISAGLAGK